MEVVPLAFENGASFNTSALNAVQRNNIWRGQSSEVIIRVSEEAHEKYVRCGAVAGGLGDTAGPAYVGNCCFASSEEPSLHAGKIHV